MGLITFPKESQLRSIARLLSTGLLGLIGLLRQEIMLSLGSPIYLL